MENLYGIGSLSMHLMLCKRQVRWLGYVRRMENGRIPKDLLYGELATGRRPVGRAVLRFKDVCKRDLKLTSIDMNNWESFAADRNGWHHAVNSGVMSGERMRTLRMEEKREQRKARQQNVEASPQSEFVCNRCAKDCHARIGLLSHVKRCSLHVQQDWFGFQGASHCLVKTEGCLLLLLVCHVTEEVL